MAAKTKALGKRPGGLSDRASDVVLVVLSVVIMLLVAYPLYYILVASFSDNCDAAAWFSDFWRCVVLKTGAVPIFPVV